MHSIDARLDLEPDPRPPTAEAPSAPAPVAAEDARLSAMRVVRRHVDQATLARLQRTDNHTNVFYIAADWLAIGGAVVTSLLVPSTVVLVCALMVIGSRQRALMNLLHQASHAQLFANHRANYWCGQLLIAFPLLIGLGSYRKSHLAHHRHLWDEELDPKTIRYGELRLVTVAPRRSRFLLRHLGYSLALRQVPANLRAALSHQAGSRVETWGRAAYWLVVVGVAVACGVERELLLYWGVPYLVVLQVIRYWTDAAEHSGLRSDDPWTATRSWTAGPLVRWLLAPHADSYHLAHHLVASVPHYRLKALHRELLQIPEYAAGHHCDGFFLRRRPEYLSVIRDICRPDCPRPALLMVEHARDRGMQRPELEPASST